MSTDDVHAIDLTLSEQDFLQFTEFTHTKSRIHRRHIARRRIRSVFWPLIVVATMTGLQVFDDPRVLTHGRYWLLMIAVAGVCGVVWAVISPFMYRACVRVNARRQFRDGTFARYFQPSRIEMSPEGFKSTGAIGTQLTAWPAILDVETTRDAAYVYLSSAAGYIIPRRAFADHTSFDAFIQNLSDFRQRFGARLAGV